jgi:hypothetical protein
VTGAVTVAVGPATVTLAGTAPGTAHVGIRWSRWLAVSRGACIRPGADGGTDVVLRSAGTVTLSSSYLAPVDGRHCGASGGA